MDAENIEQGFIMFDTDLAIGQIYFSKEPQKGGQIFDLLSPLKIILMPTAFFFLLVLFTLHFGNLCTRWKIRFLQSIFHRPRRTSNARRMMRNRYYSYYVLAHCCGFGRLTDRKLYCRLLFLSLSFFCLVVISYNRSLIKTSLVVVPDPDVWLSYEDLVRQGIRPIFVQGMTTEHHFEYSRRKSLRNNFWKYVNGNFKTSDVIVQPGQETILKHTLALMTRKSAILFEVEFIKNLQLTICNLKARDVKTLFAVVEHKHDLEDIQRMFDGALFHSSIDPAESRVAQGVVLNQYFTGIAAKRVKRQFRRSFENGIQYAILKYYQNIDVLGMLFKDRKDPSKSNLVRDCMSESVVMPEVEMVSRIAIANIFTLFVVFFSLVAFALVVLFLEIWYANY